LAEAESRKDDDKIGLHSLEVFTKDIVCAKELGIPPEIAAAYAELAAANCETIGFPPKGTGIFKPPTVWKGASFAAGNRLL
jgi:hypothetical protein